MKKISFILIFVILSTLSYAQYSSFGNNTIQINLDKESLMNKKDIFLNYLKQSYSKINIPFTNKSFNLSNLMLQVIILLISLVPFFMNINFKFKFFIFIFLEILLNILFRASQLLFNK